MKINFGLTVIHSLIFYINNLKYLNRFISFRNLILVTVIAIYGCSRQNRAVINGRIDNAAKTMVYLTEMDSAENKILDSTIIKNNGNFKFLVPLEIPGYYQLKFKKDVNLTLILSPGEKLNLNSDLNDFYNTKKIEGSLNSINVNILYDSLRNTIALLEKIKADYSIIVNSDKDPAELKNLSDKYNKIIETYRRFSIGFILKDLKSLANIGALFQEYSPGDYVFREARDMQYYKLVSDTLGKYYPKIQQVKILCENYKTFYENYQTKKMIQMAMPADNHLPDLKLLDKNGLYKTLSSLRGKAVLLSFWSVTNNDCIEYNTSLLKIYKKFRSRGFEIYQVSIDNSLEAWHKELALDKIPWISVCDTAFYNSSTRGLYNVNSLPLNYLINSDQTDLLGKNLSASALDQKLTVVVK